VSPNHLNSPSPGSDCAEANNVNAIEEVNMKANDALVFLFISILGFPSSVIIEVRLVNINVRACGLVEVSIVFSVKY